MTKLADLKELVSDNSKDIRDSIDTISKQIIEIESPSNLVEIAEAARSCISIAEFPNFWKQIINSFLLKFQEFQFEDLLDMIYTLDKLGFQDLRLHPEVLPESLAKKTKKG